MVGGISSIVGTLLVVLSLPFTSVGFVGEEWHDVTTGPGTTVTGVTVVPPGIVNATVANGDLLGQPMGGYRWRCEAPGEATIQYSVYVWAAGREPSFSNTVRCLASA